MPATVNLVLIDALYLLALINPVSKISVLLGLPPAALKPGAGRLVVESSLVAAAILLGSMVAGDFVLRSVFRVELDALRVAGGVVLCAAGFTALRRGVFFEAESAGPLAELAVVPLACPMIAGPATITACIALTAQRGHAATAGAMLAAVAVNGALMAVARPVGEALRRCHILGALIRLTGLVVMTIGVQLVADGLRHWYLNLHA